MKYLINLLPEKDRDATDKIIFFAFHYLRYILVITQFVAICVFFFRFKVDQQIVDQRDALTQKRAIVDATQLLLNEVKVLDTKVSNIKTLLNHQDKTREMYGYVLGSLSSEISVSKLNIKELIVDIEGFSPNIDVVQQLFEKMKNENKFQKVKLTSVDKREDGYVFRLTLTTYK
ncbi:hypothetical protein KAZ66_02075 [Candidatus Woesebacteria bacterium]|nr:hypothetical protein [Candidatus Woesebacteria bacterium]